MKKSLTLSAMIFFASLCCQVQAKDECVRLVMHSGDVVTFRLDSPLRVVSQDNMLVLSSSTVSAEYPAEAVSHFEFSDADVQGIAQPQVAQMQLRGGLVEFEKLSADEALRVYSADGKLLRTQKAEADGSLRLTLSNLPKGIYILKTNHQSFKINKK